MGLRYIRHVLEATIGYSTLMLYVRFKTCYVLASSVVLIFVLGCHVHETWFLIERTKLPRFFLLHF